MTPRQEALAFRIWNIAERYGWNITRREVADKLDVPVKTVSRVTNLKGWSTRFRAHKPDYAGFFYNYGVPEIGGF